MTKKAIMSHLNRRSSVLSLYMGIRENFFHRNKQKNWVNIGDGLVLWFMGSQRVGPDWATEQNWTESMNYQKNAVNQSMLISHLLFIKQIWCFYWPSRGRTKQLKADTVALAKTWQGAPHTAAEMFPGENPAPNTCTSLPPRRPLKTKMRSLPTQRQIFFFFFPQNSNLCFLAAHPSFHA